ncbi:hypothetical protein GGX14DRAFT_376713 [Mycena pura]|uniref:Uncharacterized protein n=1 Tax=Mycena pura TaxID=153505 RepID=A0AAD6UVA7_9AGAR|nr:hypothetical protein GGX14DRAFT_376713 [Mycena pura]
MHEVYNSSARGLQHPVNPDALIPTLPRVRDLVVAFFTGALETWERFTEEFAADGVIATTSTGERLRAWMPTTNDVNEGKLGELRMSSRRAPNMTLQQFNARKMYRKNDTKTYRRLLQSHDHKMIRLKARMVDSSGLTKKRRDTQAQADLLVVAAKRANGVEKAAKKKKVNAALDKLSDGLWLTEALLDAQLAWHRRAELRELKKPSESLIPKVSRLGTKQLKVDALIGAVQRYNASAGIVGPGGDQMDVIRDADDRDIVMESAY